MNESDINIHTNMNGKITLFVMQSSIRMLNMNYRKIEMSIIWFYTLSL